jgi:hypothetical protein
MHFEPPAGFSPDETMISLRAPTVGTAPSPSLVAHSKTARKGASLEELVGEMTAELVQGVSGLKDLTTAEFTFDDASTGVLIAYNLPVATGVLLRQYHVLRLDDDRLTTLTLTVPVQGVTEAQSELYVKSLASIRKA